MLCPQAILHALKAATEGRTSICIAHRLSTVADADEILVLERGAVSERGTHHQLISNPNSLYAQLWDKQKESPRTIPSASSATTAARPAGATHGDHSGCSH